MSKYRRALRNSVSAEARAYGFSLVVLTTGYLCVDEHKLPASSAHSASSAAPCSHRSSSRPEYHANGSGHVLSVIAGVLAGWGVAKAVHGHDLAYFLSSLIAVAVYQLAMAGELALALLRSSDS